MEQQAGRAPRGDEGGEWRQEDEGVVCVCICVCVLYVCVCVLYVCVCVCTVCVCVFVNEICITGRLGEDIVQRQCYFKQGQITVLPTVRVVRVLI